MTSDPLLQVLARLPHAESDPVRGERVRARCLAALARQHRPDSSGTSRFSAWPVVAGLGCAYVAETIRLAIRLYGIV